MVIRGTCERGHSPKIRDGLRGSPARDQPVKVPDPEEKATGKGERVYPFQEACHTYKKGVRKSSEWLTGHSSAVWKWFWKGAGGKAIEKIVLGCVPLCGLTCGVMYVAAEQGRGSAPGLAVAFVLIAAFAAVLAYSWATLVHAVGQTAAGVCAVGPLFLVGGVVLLAGTLVFSAWFLGLLAWTASFCVVFVPMRAYHAFRTRMRGLGYLCPYGCTSKRSHGPPVHACPRCGERYPDLRPSFYGIFHHTCRHPDGTKTRLPTLDGRGRKKIKRYCPECGGEIIFSSLGELAPYPIALVGGTAVGKTIFLCQAVRELCDPSAAWPNGQVQIDAARQRKEVGDVGRILDNGRLPPKTARVASAVGVAARVPGRGIARLLYLYDAPGEDFETLRKFGSKQSFQTHQAILLLVDPSSLPKLSRQTRRFHAGAVTDPVPFDTMAGNLVQSLGAVRARNPAGQFDVPLAVVLTKGDALPTGHPFLADLYGANGRAPVKDRNKRCRDALVRLGGGHPVRVLEQNFATVRYFACSALGRPPSPSNRRPFKPAGVVEPVQWAAEIGLPQRGKLTVTRAS